jgi:hypothetical protein
MYKPCGANVGPRSCSLEVVAFCGYEAAGARLLLTVEQNTLVSGKGLMVAGSTLGYSAAPTLRAVALGGRVGLMMECRFRIAVLQLAASMAVIGMVLHDALRTLRHAARTVRSAVEIVGIAQWLG